jgi:tRNA threonylcarbamoyladenosine biosynthesis protein TsaB
MLLLAVDTSGRDGGFELCRDGETLCSRLVHVEKGFGPEIFVEIEKLLREADVRYADIEAYAAAAGPGSFTGVRVGLTAVKALAETHGKRIVPVSNLEALAWAGQGELRAPVLDARRGEVYAALYDASLRPVEPETVGPWGEFLERLGSRHAELISLRDGLFEQGGAAALPAGDARARRSSGPLIGAVAALGRKRFGQGRAVEPERVEANYVRRPDAERNWKS